MSILQKQQNKLTVADVTLPIERTPVTSERTLMKEAIEIMDTHKLGIVCIKDDEGYLSGIITDGDIRRMLISVQKPLAAIMSDDVINWANRSPISVNPSLSLQLAINLMGKRQIWDLPVVENGELLGLLHLHPAIEAVIGEKK